MRVPEILLWAEHHFSKALGSPKAFSFLENFRELGGGGTYKNSGEIAW